MRQLLTVISLVSPILMLADSPLTSTLFHSAYSNVKMVQYAEDKGTMDKKIAKFLLRESNPIDVKLAVISALGWSTAGQQNAEAFLKHVAAKHRTTPAALDIASLTPDAAICIAYLTALDDYFNPQNAMPFVEQALAKGSTSYALNMIAALIKAQVAFDFDWCEVYQLAFRVHSDESLVQDMREEAVYIIMEYMDLYSSECS